MPITILLVDDSAVIRFLFGKSLERDPDLRVVGNASNGIEGIEQARKLQPDMVLLDIEMPGMDGLKALPKILAASRHSRLMMVTGTADKYAGAAINALGLGASEFLLKPGVDGTVDHATFIEEMRVKIKELCASQLTRPRQHTGLPRPAPDAARVTLTHGDSAPGDWLAPVTALPRLEANLPPLQRADGKGDIYRLQPRRHHEVKALAIAASTGGPEALITMFGALKDELLHIPIFITQHMPPHFTIAFAEQIARNGKRSCKEAEHGEIVVPGTIYIAPGGMHMLVKKHGGKTIIALNEHPPVNSCRPSADPMFASISDVYGRHALGLVLTGIGNDGAMGARTLFANGGAVLTQDRASSVIYGMPRYTAETGVCEAILALDKIPATLIQRCKPAKSAA